MKLFVVIHLITCVHGFVYPLNLFRQVTLVQMNCDNTWHHRREGSLETSRAQQQSESHERQIEALQKCVQQQSEQIEAQNSRLRAVCDDLNVIKGSLSTLYVLGLVGLVLAVVLY